jgi:hypothetical protein
MIRHAADVVTLLALTRAEGFLSGEPWWFFGVVRIRVFRIVVHRIKRVLAVQRTFRKMHSIDTLCKSIP